MCSPKQGKSLTVTQNQTFNYKRTFDAKLIALGKLLQTDRNEKILQTSKEKIGCITSVV